MDEALRQAHIRQANKRLIRRLLLVLAGAIAFSIAMVPLYNLLCKVTGLNGKTEGRVAAAEAKAAKVDKNRWITVEFTSEVMPGLRWEFHPAQPAMRVHPGEVHLVKFYVKNPTSQEITGQAVPSVSPGWAAQYFRKLECFCFAKQTLMPGEAKEMPLTFFINPEMPGDVATISLSYTFFPIDKSYIGKKS